MAAEGSAKTHPRAAFAEVVLLGRIEHKSRVDQFTEEIKLKHKYELRISKPMARSTGGYPV